MDVHLLLLSEFRDSRLNWLIAHIENITIRHHFCSKILFRVLREVTKGAPVTKTLGVIFAILTSPHFYPMSFKNQSVIQHHF